MNCIFWWNLIPELIGSLVGAFLGFLLGILLERSIRKDELKREKEQIVKSLLIESEANAIDIEEQWAVREIGDGRHVIAFWAILFVKNYDGVINSGNIIHLSPETQIKLQSLYLRINWMNRLVDRLYIEINSKVINPGTSSEMRDTLAAIKDEMPDVISSLKSEIVDKQC